MRELRGCRSSPSVSVPILNPITYLSIPLSQYPLLTLHNLSILTSISSSTIHPSTYSGIYPSVSLYLHPIILFVYQSIHPSKHPSIPLSIHLPSCPLSAIHPLPCLLSIIPAPVELLDHFTISLSLPTCPLICYPYLLYSFSSLSIYHPVCLPSQTDFFSEEMSLAFLMFPKMLLVLIWVAACCDF